MRIRSLPGRVAARLKRVPTGLSGLPGPGRNFPVGNGLDFALRPPWEVTKEFWDRYGPISLAWLGPFPMVMLQDPDAIARVLVEGDANGDVYKAEPIDALLPLSPPNTSTFTLNGPEHTRARKTGMTAHPSFGPWLDETAEALVRLSGRRARSDLTQQGPGFEDRFKRFMFDAVSVAVAGTELGDEAFEDGMTVFRTVDVRMRTNLPVYSPTFFAARRRWWNVFRERVAAQVAGRGMGGLIAHALPGARVSQDQFAISMSNVYPGGFFSTSSVLLNALVCLDRHPHIAAELRRAIKADKALGGPITKARLAAIAPLERVIRETLRLFPPVPLFMRRVARSPLTLGTHVMDPGTILALCVGPLQTSPAHWSAPQDFDPSRWTPELMAERPYGSAYFFPFGRGPRECEGRDIALTMVRAVLYGILAEGVVKVDGVGPAAQRFFFAVMTPERMSGGTVPDTGSA